MRGKTNKIHIPLILALDTVFFFGGVQEACVYLPKTAKFRWLNFHHEVHLSKFFRRFRTSSLCSQAG